MTARASTAILPVRTDVLIVGAGPAGLSLAASLRQLGVDHLLIDRNAGVQPGSKAAFVQPAALEYLDRIGVSERLVKAGVRASGFRLHDRTQVLLRATYDALDTPYPYLLLVSQQTTEEHLLARLESLAGAVHRSHTFLGYHLDFPGVTAIIAGLDGVLHAVSARYLVGCDGVHSAVRTAAGIGFPGDSPEQRFALADVRLRLGSEAAAWEEPMFFLSPQGMLLVAPLAGGLHRIVATAAPGVTSPTAQDAQRFLADRGPRAGGVQVSEVVAASTYHVQERVATQFSEGPIFLAGDAAHTHSPAGGQGMNTGIQDAGNLAWKLHAVLTGSAPAALLDSYHRERHPVAAEVVSFTSQFVKVATLKDLAACQRRNDVIAAVAATPGITSWLATKVAELSIDYADDTDRQGDGRWHVGQRISPIAVPPSGLCWTLALSGQTAPDRTSGHEDRLCIRSIEGLQTSLLVRPDGYLAAHGVPADPGAVLDHLAAYLPLQEAR
jgi:2-polyprenyl-6-methoxyphenol hydroxylase-like FAD-dependent oxidoreductase